MTRINYGYIHEEPPYGEVFFGGETRKKLKEDHNWIDLVPRPQEIQSFKYFGTSACVTYMLLKIYSTLLYRKYGIRFNFSERATAVLSNTRPGYGNTFTNVLLSTMRDGLMLEDEYPVDFEMKSVEEYYQPLSEENKTKAKKNGKMFSIASTWIETNPYSIYDALQYGLPGVAWYVGKPRNGIYPRYENPANHGITICGAEYEKCFYAADSLGGSEYIKVLAWDSKFDAAILPDISLNNMTKFKIAKEENGKGYALLGEANQEEEFKNVCQFLGIPIPTIDGKIDWPNVEHVATYKK